MRLKKERKRRSRAMYREISGVMNIKYIINLINRNEAIS